MDFEAIVQSGRPVILAFWSKYCKACVEKFSALVALQTKYEPQGLQVISVNTDGEYREGEATIREFLVTIEAQRKIKINFPVIYDDHNWIPHALGINFLPTIIAVDAQGRVLDLYQKFDEAGEAEILAGIEALVQKAVATAPGARPPPPGKTLARRGVFFRLHLGAVRRRIFPFAAPQSSWPGRVISPQAGGAVP